MNPMIGTSKEKSKKKVFYNMSFKDNSSAVRHYGQLGIASKERVKAASGLEDKIIKASQKKVMIDSLLPLKNSIDALITATENLDRRQSEHFNKSTKESEHIERQLSRVLEKVQETLKELSDDRKINQATVKNVIILRSLLYIFLLGYKTGKVEPNEKIRWDQIVLFGHQLADEYAKIEIAKIEDETLNDPVVSKLANELFAEMKRMMQAKD